MTLHLHHVPPPPAIAARCADTADLAIVLHTAHMHAMQLAYSAGRTKNWPEFRAYVSQGVAIRRELNTIGRDELAGVLERGAASTLARHIAAMGDAA